MIQRQQIAPAIVGVVSGY